MNKRLLAIAGCVLACNTYAKATSCGYKDFFHLSDSSHPAIYVVSSFSESDVILEMVGPRSFIIRDGYSCHSGYAHVTVAYDPTNWCVLDIKDGPYMNHPIVSASCNGIRYLNTTYDGFGSYSYSINLD